MDADTQTNTSPLLLSSPPVRRSKKADEERQSKARQAREESQRQSVRALGKGRVAGLSGLFQTPPAHGPGPTVSRRHSSDPESSSPGRHGAGAHGSEHGRSGPHTPAASFHRRRHSRRHSRHISQPLDRYISKTRGTAVQHGCLVWYRAAASVGFYCVYAIHIKR